MLFSAAARHFVVLATKGQFKGTFAGSAQDRFATAAARPADDLPAHADATRVVTA